ncbi:CPK2 [Symbiodinium sp. KB8]|nr:CPK2 [Symbiodinium sp. KB8]
MPWFRRSSFRLPTPSQGRDHIPEVPPNFRSQLVHEISHYEIDRKYETRQLLGQGSYGSVHLVCERTTQQKKASKSIARPEAWGRERFRMEGMVMQNADHPYILRLFEWFENGDQATLICQFCEGGELLSAIRKGRASGSVLEESWAACALRQPFQALVYLHNKGIVHKDLKVENLLLLRSIVSDDGRAFGRPPHVVVSDFGTAEICMRGLSSPFVARGTKVAGTPATMSPECLQGNCSAKSDIWSMGCVMYEMFANVLPFHLSGSMADADAHQDAWLQLHKQGPKWDKLRCSTSAKDLCQKLLSFREVGRPNATDCLKHSWLKQQKSNLGKEEKTFLRTALTRWASTSQCGKALFLKMASTCSFVDRFAQAFCKLDSDDNGMLERNEVFSATQMLGIQKDAAKKLVNALDQNCDGSIQYLEFCAACLLASTDELYALLSQEFQALCAGEKGCPRQALQILLKDLRPLVADSGGYFPEEVKKEGRLSFKDFCLFFGQQVEEPEEPEGSHPISTTEMESMLKAKEEVPSPRSAQSSPRAFKAQAAGGHTLGEGETGSLIRRRQQGHEKASSMPSTPTSQSAALPMQSKANDCDVEFRPVSKPKAGRPSTPVEGDARRREKSTAPETPTLTMPGSDMKANGPKALEHSSVGPSQMRPQGSPGRNSRSAKNDSNEASPQATPRQSGGVSQKQERRGPPQASRRSHVHEPAKDGSVFQANLSAKDLHPSDLDAVQSGRTVEKTAPGKGRRPSDQELKPVGLVPPARQETMSTQSTFGGMEFETSAASSSQEEAIPPSFDTSVSQADPTAHIENNKDDNVILPDHVAQNAREDTGTAFNFATPAKAVSRVMVSL